MLGFFYCLRKRPRRKKVYRYEFRRKSRWWLKQRKIDYNYSKAHQALKSIQTPYVVSGSMVVETREDRYNYSKLNSWPCTSSHSYGDRRTIELYQVSGITVIKA